MKPAYVNQPIFWNFRTAAARATIIAATNVNHTVHAACLSISLYDFVALGTFAYLHGARMS